MNLKRSEQNAPYGAPKREATSDTESDTDMDSASEYRAASASEDEEDEEENERRAALAGLEALTLAFVQQLASGLHSLRGGAKKAVVVLELKKRGRGADAGTGMRRVSFPGRTGARPIAQLLAVVDALHEAVTDDVPVTKRDIFYRNSELFHTQATVDRLVDDIAATLGLGRAALRVRAAGKGLFAGSALVAHLRAGGRVCGADGGGTLIPDGAAVERFELLSPVRWVLVVEKEAVFQTLCALGFAGGGHALGPGIVITGKGYADVATRQLLATLADNLLADVPLAALVDADPHGLAIGAVYARGSAALAHERGLVARRLRWLGLGLADVAAFGGDGEAVKPLTAQDEKKARALLAEPDEVFPSEWRPELERMLETRTKASIEIVCDAPRIKGGEHPLVTYLVQKLGAMLSE